MNRRHVEAILRQVQEGTLTPEEGAALLGEAGARGRSGSPAPDPVAGRRVRGRTAHPPGEPPAGPPDPGPDRQGAPAASARAHAGGGESVRVQVTRSDGVLTHRETRESTLPCEGLRVLVVANPLGDVILEGGGEEVHARLEVTASLPDDPRAPALLEGFAGMLRRAGLAGLLRREGERAVLDLRPAASDSLAPGALRADVHLQVPRGLEVRRESEGGEEILPLPEDPGGRPG